MKICVTTYSFSKYFKETGCDLFEICDRAKAIGFEGIEFTALELWDKEKDKLTLARELREYCKKIGLEIVSYTVGADFLSEDGEAVIAEVKKCVDIASELGASVMRHDVCYKLPKEHLYSYRDAIKTMAPRIREVAEYARGKGVRTCTENHGYVFQDPRRVEELILAVGSDNYGWLCDIGNFLCMDCDPITSVSTAAPYTFHAHVKDFLFRDGTYDAPPKFITTLGGNHIRGTVLGHGVVPVKSCITALKRGGYNGWVSLEFEGMEDNIPALEAGFEFLSKLI